MPEEGVFETEGFRFFYRKMVTNEDRLNLEYAPWVKTTTDEEGKVVQVYDQRPWAEFMLKTFCTGWEGKRDPVRILFDWKEYLALPSEGGSAIVLALEIWNKVMNRDVLNIETLKKTFAELSGSTSTASGESPTPKPTPS